MPLIRQISVGDVLVGIWQITESSETLADMFCALFGRHAIPDYLTAEARRREWLASRLLLCELVGHPCRLLNDDNGRPFLVNGDVEVSISHTKGYAAVAVSKNRVGLDIELRNRNVLGAQRCFLGSLEMASMNNDNTKALLCWSAKEALFKVVGNLGGTFKENIIVEPFDVADCGMMKLRLCGVDEAFAGVYDVCYSFWQDIAMTLCLGQAKSDK